MQPSQVNLTFHALVSFAKIFVRDMQIQWFLQDIINMFLEWKSRYILIQINEISYAWWKAVTQIKQM